MKLRRLHPGVSNGIIATRGKKAYGLWNLRYECRSHPPSGLPCLLMVTTDAQTYLSVGLEATAGCRESKHGGSQGIRWVQDYATMVDATAVDGTRRALESEVPLEQVGF